MKVHSILLAGGSSDRFNNEENKVYFPIGGKPALSGPLETRGNNNLSPYQDPLHPAVLRAISNVIDSCIANNTEVSVCGEMSSDPVSALVLYILGLKIFSMAPSAAPFVFDALDTHSKINKQKIKDQILQQNNADEVRTIIQEILS